MRLDQFLICFWCRSEENENYGLIRSVLLASHVGQDVTNLGVNQVDLQS